MEKDIVLQIVMIAFILALFYFLNTLPKRGLAKLRSSSTSSHRHFIKGAQLLSRARSTKSKSTSLTLATSAANEADQAIAIDPKDPAAHILKAMALTILAHKSSALKSLDTALSPPAVKMLSGVEKGDALFKRAELLVELSRKRRVDSAIEDLLEAVQLSKDNAKAFCLLGRCYEIKGLRDEAEGAFRNALALQPGLQEARLGGAVIHTAPPGSRIRVTF